MSLHILYIYYPSHATICCANIMQEMLLVNHPESADANAKCDLLMCILRWVLWANDLVHTVQENGFSPVWVRLCITKWAGFLNALSHFWHLYCLWLLWMDWWLKRWLDLLKPFFANIARIWSSSGMNHFVSCKITLVSKCFLEDFTNMWSFSTV